MPKAAIYIRFSLPTQDISTYLLPLRELAAKRGYQLVAEYQDHGISGAKARRPGLDALMADARCSKFSVVLVMAFSQIARSTRHFLQTIEQLGSLGIEFISLREAIDTGEPTGGLFLTLIRSISELDGELVREKIRRGMYRRRLEGFRLGRAPLSIDHQALVRDRRSGMSLSKVAKKYSVSRASVVRFTREAVKGEATKASEFQPATIQEPAGCVA